MVEKKRVKKKSKSKKVVKKKRKVVKRKKISKKKKSKSLDWLGNKTDESQKENKINRVPTGAVNYDKLIGGGFEKNSTNLLVGGSGSGKTILATQFLVGGMKKGEKCLYVTFEEQKEQFYHNMKAFGWDLAAYEKKGLFTFLQYTPIKVRTMLEEGGGEIERAIVGKKVTRIVIDSITSFALLFKDELAKREAALSLFGMIRNWEATALLTLEEEPSIDATRGAPKTLEFEVDSLTFLYFIRTKEKRERFIEILKMRGTNHSKKIHSFEIKKKGAVIGRNSVSRLPSL
jgi:circadian clock protein KaiC